MDVTEPLTVGLDGEYRELFDHVSDGLVVHEPNNGVVREVNERFVELSGVGRDELVGRRITELIDDDRRPVLRCRPVGRRRSTRLSRGRRVRLDRPRSVLRTAR